MADKIETEMVIGEDLKIKVPYTNIIIDLKESVREIDEILQMHILTEIIIRRNGSVDACFVKKDYPEWNRILHNIKKLW